MTHFSWTKDSTASIYATSSVHPITGEIHDVRGEADVEVDGDKVVGGSGYLEADVDSLKSGKKLEDMALRKQVEAKKYPTIRYEVRSVDGGPDTFKVTGAFTFHGVSQEFVEECTARIVGGALMVDSEHTFDIQDFGVKPFKLLSLSVHPQVKVTLHLVGR